MMVMQIQLTKRQGVVPITRDYIVHEERAPARRRSARSAAAAACGRIAPTSGRRLARPACGQAKTRQAFTHAQRRALRDIAG